MFENSLINVSIIIPVFNDTVGLDVTLESISENFRDRKEIEVLVCNDGGGDKVSKIVAFYGFHEVRLNNNRGSYAARNKGIKEARGSLLAFLDADQRVSVKWLDAGLRALQSADYVGGQVKIDPGINPSSWELFDELYAFPVIDYLNKLHFAPTANLFMLKYVFKDVGLFNETLRSGGDREFGLRVYKAGYKQTYCPEAITFHPARSKSEQLVKQKRIGAGLADLHCIVWKKNPLLFLLYLLIQFFQVLLRTVYNFFRYILIDYWVNEKKSLLFIAIDTVQKLIRYWYAFLRTIEVMALRRWEIK